jgi:hypothetical protein
MSRPFLYIDMKTEKANNEEETAQLKKDIIQSLFEYLGSYKPKREGESKGNLMGPVGKLLSAVSSERFENEDAIMGYVINIHNNTSTLNLTPVSLVNLKTAINSLHKIRLLANERMWLRILREIDYAVFLRQYDRVANSGALPAKGVEK